MLKKLQELVTKDRIENGWGSSHDDICGNCELPWSELEWDCSEHLTAYFDEAVKQAELLQNRNDFLVITLNKVLEYIIQASVNWNDPHPGRTANTRGESADEAVHKAWDLLVKAIKEVNSPEPILAFEQLEVDLEVANNKIQSLEKELQELKDRLVCPF